MLFTVSKYLFSFQRYSSFKICKLAKWWCHALHQILIKYDKQGYLSQFLSEKFDFLELLCSMSLQPCYHGNMLVFRPLRYKRLFWTLEAFYTVYCQWCVICMIQQAFKYVRLSSWPCLMSSKLRITKILKSRLWVCCI